LRRKGRHGGPRQGAGALPGNGNARKGMALPAWLNLESSESILKFIKTILIPAAVSGRLGTRQVSSITTACKVLLDYQSLQDLEKRLELLEEAKGVKVN